MEEDSLKNSPSVTAPATPSPQDASQLAKNEVPKPPERKKYIRTFAADMETVQKGGMPDLVPLEAPQAKDRLVEASPIRSLPPPTPIPPPSPAITTPKPPPLVSPIETYASHFSDKVKAEHASPATILAAEQDNAPAPIKPAPPAVSNGNLVYIVGGVLLLVLGGAGAGFAYFRYQTTLAPIVLAPVARAPIFVDEREEVSGSGFALVKAIEDSVKRPLAPNTVRLLYMSTATSSVFSELDISAPSVLLRNMQADGSMAGVINAGGEQGPFFILSVAAYGSTLAGMLAWETVMPNALSVLYPPRPVSSTAATTTATSTIPSTVSVQLASTLGFKDESVANHDVRAYRDATGRIIVLYGYWNQRTLVIARNPQAFTEILERLATSRVE